jgi:hypothetical protein
MNFNIKDGQYIGNIDHDATGEVSRFYYFGNKVVKIRQKFDIVKGYGEVVYIQVLTDEAI